MLEIKNVKIYGLEQSFVRSGFPMLKGNIPVELDISKDNDRRRSIKLGQCGTGEGHDNFLKGITVQFDVKYNQNWSRQLQRYHFIEIISSQSTMHRLKDMDFGSCFSDYVDKEIIERLETIKQEYKADPSSENFHRLALSCPMGLEMWMGISTNYMQLKTIYKQRRSHKMEDWQIFCDWIETLPMFMELTQKPKKETKNEP